MSTLASRIAARRLSTWQTLPRPDLKSVVLVLTVVFVVYQVVVPLFFLIWGSLKAVGPTDETYFTFQFTLDNYVRALSGDEFWSALANTLVFSVGSTFFATLIGALLALIVARTDAPGKSVINTLAYARIIVPGLFTAIAWVFLASPEIGLLNRAYRDATGASRPIFDVYSLAGMIWVMSLDTFPLVYMTLVGTLRSMDPSLEEAALVSGVSIGQTLRRITFSLARPALLVAVILVLIFSIESFEVPLIIGLPRKIYVLSSEIYFKSTRTPVDFGIAASFGVLLLVLSLVLLVTYQRMVRRATAYVTVSGKAFRPRVIRLGRWRWAATALALLLLGFAVLLPTLVLIWASFLRFFQPPSAAALKVLSLSNYERVLSNTTVHEGLRNSLLLGVGAATVVALIAAIIAWIVYRTRLPGREVLDGLAFAPRAVPAVLFAVSMLWLYLTVPLPIYGTLVIILLAYITRYLPVAVRIISAGVIQIHRELEEAAYTSGASWLVMFARVLLPLLRPVLLTAWIWVALHSFRELSISAVLAAPGSRTVAVAIYELWSEGSLGLIAAFSVLVLAMLLIVSWGAETLARRFGVSGLS